MLHDPHWQTKTDARKILDGAAAYLDSHDWCQRALEHNGRVCLLGAIRTVCLAMLSDDVQWEVINRLRKATKAYNIAAWNDAPGRTKKQVIAVLRRAAR